MFAKKQKEAIEKSKMLDSKKGGQVPKIVIKKCTEIIKKLDHENKKHQILKSLFLIKINSTIKAPQPFKKTPTDIKSLQTLTSCRSTSLFSVTIKDFTYTPILSKTTHTPHLNSYTITLFTKEHKLLTSPLQITHPPSKPP